MTTFRTLDEVLAVPEPEARATAVSEFFAELDRLRSKAAQVRHAAIAEVLQRDDRALWSQPAKVAARCGVSVSTVKAVRYLLDTRRTLDE